MLIRLVSGEAFDLPADFSVEITRINPFFSELGEHSIPVTLPPTDTNKRLLGFPHDIGVGVIRSSYDVSIEDGAFFFPAKMLLLSANEADGFECSFVLNMGKLYSVMQKDKLSDVVERQYKKLDYGTARAAMLYLESVARKAELTDADIIDIFPILADKQILNEYKFRAPTTGSIFAANVDRKIDIGGQMTVIPACFLLTPFLRLRPLLQRIFKHYGYAISDWGVLDEAPYGDIVLLNNNYDSIVNGYITPLQLAPDCSVVELLSAVEGKFMSRWVADESATSVRFVRFDTLLEEENTDLSDRLAGSVTFRYPQKYRRLELKSSSFVAPRFPDGVDGEGYTQIDNLKEVLRKRKGLCIDIRTGILYRFMVMSDMTGKLLSVGSLVTNYIDEHKDYEAEVVDCGDTVPALQLPYVKTAFEDVAIAQVGDGRWLNSFCRLADGKTADEEDKGELPIIFAMPVSGQGVLRQGGLIDSNTQKSLLYNGDKSLFELYYRKYEELLRYGLTEAEATLQLRGVDKMTLSAVKPLVIEGNRFFPEKIGYSTASGSSSTVSLRSLSMRPHLSSSDQSFLTSSEYLKSAGGTLSALPRYTWEVELRWKYSLVEPVGSQVHFYDENDLPECDAQSGGPGTYGPDAPSPGLYDWGKAYQPLYEAFQQRGDRVVPAPTKEQIETGMPYVYAYSRYDLGSSPMPQPLPDPPGGGLNPVDPPPAPDSRYFTIFFCLKPKPL